MTDTYKVQCELAGGAMIFETGLMALQAGGSLTVRLGDTVVFSAATAAKEPREGVDYFPLQIDYREKFYAAGRFPGGYFKREARPSEKEILTARMTDRPIRPLFPEGYRNEVQVMNTVLSADGANEADILSINAASAALVISDIPFNGPIGAVRVGRVNGEFVLNPTHDQIKQSDLDLIYCGTRDLPLMIEGSADEIPEADLVQAMRFGHEAVVKLVDVQIELRRAMGKPDKEIAEAEPDRALMERAEALVGPAMMDALAIGDKLARQDRIAELREELKKKLEEENAETEGFDEIFFQLFDAFETRKVRELALEKGTRIGGRGFDEIRPLDARVQLLPRTHGSALFSRGETQALAVVTLGSSSDAQSMDAVTGGMTEKKFMLHYNFPPYSVGETGRIGFTGRREIGHGNLAERSLLPMLPKDSAYAIRLVSEIMGSNGSSSMASICVGSLALMDAGVKMKKAVAGISIGLVYGGDRSVLLTDIIGAEDHCGDMDYKVAGTRDGITGFQVDLKIPGLPWDLVEGAFEKARAARIKILDYMAGVLEAPRAELSPYAPRIETVMIPVDKIGLLIGPGGKTIKRITETYGVEIDIEDDGTVNIFSADESGMAGARREVELMAAEAEVDKIYRGTVTGVKDFGAFVEILPGKEGLVHISEMADFRVNKVEDICKVGDAMWVKCLAVEENGRIRLSRREALKEKDETEKDESEEA